MNILLPTLHIAQSCSQDDESSPLQDRIDTLLKLEEEREKSRNKLYHHQQLVKIWFDDKYSTIHEFHIVDLVLKWDKPHKEKWEYTKFQRLWLGPFIITEKLGPGSVRLQMLEGLSETYPTNIQLLKKYFAWGKLCLPIYRCVLLIDLLLHLFGLIDFLFLFFTKHCMFATASCMW